MSKVTKEKCAVCGKNVKTGRRARISKKDGKWYLRSQELLLKHSCTEIMGWSCDLHVAENAACLEVRLPKFFLS